MATRETYADLTIRVFERQDQGYPVEITCAGLEFPRGYLSPEVVSWTGSASPEEEGERLFDALLGDDKLKIAWARATGRSPQRRVRLQIDESAPELVPLPWELLRDTTAGAIPQTLAADSDTPFSRYLRGPWDPGGLVATRPLRMLVAIANPTNLGDSGLSPLDVEKEQQILEQALAGLAQTQVHVHFLPPPVTLDALRDELLHSYHILHVVAHGQYDEGQEQAFLLLANEENLTCPVSGTEFAKVLTWQKGFLRFVFLASCQTAVESPRAAFRGLASLILAAGVPAVLAMQDLAPEEMVRELTATFYRQLLCHGQVDLAANEARAAILTRRLPESWGIAALYSRLPDNRLAHFVEMSAEEVTRLHGVADMPRGVTPGGVEALAARQTVEQTRALQVSVDEALTMLKGAETPPAAGDQIQVGDVQMSRLELLLSKATLLETEAEQMTQAYSQAFIPRLFNDIAANRINWQASLPRSASPFRARLKAGLLPRMDTALRQGLGLAANQLGPAQWQQMVDVLTDRFLDDFDLAAYEARINEAYALLEEASELAPDHAEVALHIAKLQLALHPDDPGQGQRLWTVRRPPTGRPLRPPRPVCRAVGLRSEPAVFAAPGVDQQLSALHPGDHAPGAAGPRLRWPGGRWVSVFFDAGGVGPPRVQIVAQAISRPAAQDFSDLESRILKLEELKKSIHEFGRQPRLAAAPCTDRFEGTLYRERPGPA